MLTMNAVTPSVSPSASRPSSSGFRTPQRHASFLMDPSRFPSAAHAHDFNGPNLSRVVMVRKTEQRTFASNKTGEEPKFETVTKETVETIRGHRTERVTTSARKDAFDSTPGSLRSALPSLGSRSTTESRSPSISPDRKSQKTPSISRLSTSRANSTLCSRAENSVDGESFTEGDFYQDCLNEHNRLRALHGVPPLKINKKLSKISDEWAKHLATKCTLEHRQNSDYGENLWSLWSSDPNTRITGRDPVINWYNEISDYHFGREPNNLKAGHFTQVVWRDSRELGIGFAKNRNGMIYVVCNYSPPGNFIGSFTENVPPVGGFTNKSTPTNSTGVAPLENVEKFAKDGLAAHNEFRRKHGVPELKLSKQLTDYAKEWAETLAKEDRFSHRPDPRYGENLFSLWSSDVSSFSARDACLTWYKESKDHVYGTEPRNSKSGHFTQMIWRQSTQLGIAMARGRKGQIIVVANYHPRGNIIGQFVSNVPRPV